MSDEQLAREHAQLVREQGLLGMPFLNEDLPFLAQFDGHPPVSIDRALEIVQAENSATTTASAAETPSAVEHDMGAFNAPEVGYNELLANYDPPTFTTAAETTPDLDMFEAPEVDADDLLGNPAAVHTSTSSGATPTTAAPGPDGFKKSCTTCAARKVKCEIIAGSSPRVCKYCQDKGLACEFELKKSHQKAQS
ncbi:hypothetical protein KCU99_g10153, partial [Aureobasidium melanogenum]